MEKLIDNIIELVIGDMDCHHEVDHEEDGVHTSVEYNLTGETKIRGMIIELIEQWNEKKKVTEEWIEEKAIAISHAFNDIHRVGMEQARDFIRSLVEEIQ